MEVFDFDNSSGQVANPRSVNFSSPTGFDGYGLEFSPNSNVLYATDISRLFQIVMGNVLTPVLLGASIYSFLQRGPDNRIYVANYQARALGVVAAPDVVGPGCGFLPGGQDLGGKRSLHGLPNFPNQPPRPTRIVAPRVACVG